MCILFSDIKNEKKTTNTTWCFNLSMLLAPGQRWSMLGASETIPHVFRSMFMYYIICIYIYIYIYYIYILYIYTICI